MKKRQQQLGKERHRERGEEGKREKLKQSEAQSKPSLTCYCRQRRNAGTE